MSWCQPTRYHNEHMFLGPHPLLSALQQEMNALGRQEHPWSVHGWERQSGGWIALMVRSVEVKPSEDA